MEWDGERHLRKPTLGGATLPHCSREQVVDSVIFHSFLCSHTMENCQGLLWWSQSSLDSDGRVDNVDPQKHALTQIMLPSSQPTTWLDYTVSFVLLKLDLNSNLHKNTFIFNWPFYYSSFQDYWIHKRKITRISNNASRNTSNRWDILLNSYGS